MHERTIRELQGMMETGALTARGIVESCLERIDEIDRSGPALNAIIELNPEALAIADALDQERRSTGPREPLHGIPVVLKDNIDTGDRMMTTAASLALVGSRASVDAFLVRRLRKAGAIILGKANLSEWANFRGKRSTSGWSSRGGQTVNPYALDRNPCGSSSGSAVAVAADLCAVSVGTETDGSIICPASINGVVGIKPTLGLVSRWGIIPVAHSQDTAGPMGRTVEDAAILLGAMVGVDPRDAATEASRPHSHVDYAAFLDADGMRGARIGVARGFFGFDPRVDAIMQVAIGTMRDLGAEIIDPVDLKAARQLGENESIVLHYEFKADLNGYLGRLGPEAPVHSLDEVIAFNEDNRQRVMPFFGQEHMIEALAKGSLSDATYLEALAENRRRTRDEGIDAALAAHELDAIVAPSNGPAWLTERRLRAAAASALPGPFRLPTVERLRHPQTVRAVVLYVEVQDTYAAFRASPDGHVCGGTLTPPAPNLVGVRGGVLETARRQVAVRLLGARPAR